MNPRKQKHSGAALRYRDILERLERCEHRVQKVDHRTFGMPRLYTRGDLAGLVNDAIERHFHIEHKRRRDNRHANAAVFGMCIIGVLAATGAAQVFKWMALLF